VSKVGAWGDVGKKVLGERETCGVGASWAGVEGAEVNAGW